VPAGARVEALERLAGTSDEWSGHPDADIYRVYPWMAYLSESELARGVATIVAMEELRAVGEAHRATVGGRWWSPAWPRPHPRETRRQGDGRGGPSSENRYVALVSRLGVRYCLGVFVTP
jgi:hypothetical protein